jgi:hypothetical protein
MKKLLLIGGLLLLAKVSFAQEPEIKYPSQRPGAGRLDAKGGVQDVRFGLDTARLANRRLIERAGDLLYYERTNEAPTLAGAKVKIAYGFIKNKLVSIRVRTTETNDSENLLYGLRLAA